MFGSNINHEQDSQSTVQESRTDDVNNITCDFPTSYTTQSTTLTITVCVHVAIKLIYQYCNVSYSKNQSTILTILLL